MSELDAALLARHTRLLLRCYPKAYRAHRGEEIFDTLLETTRPGRGWPPAREVASVIGGGLRARRAANLNQGLRASLRHVGILTAAMLMAGTPASLLFEAGQYVAEPSLPYSFREWMQPLALESFIVVMALAAAWSGRRWLAVAAAAAAAAFSAVAWHVQGTWPATIAESWPTALALVALLPLTKRAERPPASLLWLPGLPVAAAFVEGLGLAGHDRLPVLMFSRTEFLLSPYYTYLSLVPVLVAVCWLVTDVRPLAAITLQFLLLKASSIARHTYPDSRPQLVIVTGLLLALAGVLVWLLRHRARTTPPTTG